MAMKPSTIASNGDEIVSSLESSGWYTPAVTPFSTWRCPNCVPSSQTGKRKMSILDNDDSGVMAFLRGTCEHDLCFKCLAKLSSFVKKKKKKRTNEDDANLFVMVPCPIVCRGSGRICDGVFPLDGANYRYCRSLLNYVKSNEDIVIDISDDEQGEEPKRASLAPVVDAEQLHIGIQGVVKKEPKKAANGNNDKLHDSDDAEGKVPRRAAGGGVVAIKREMQDDVRTSSPQHIVQREIKQERCVSVKTELMHPPQLEPVFSVNSSSLSSSVFGKSFSEKEEGTRAYSTRIRKSGKIVSQNSDSTIRVKKSGSGTKAGNNKETIANPPQLEPVLSVNLSSLSSSVVAKSLSDKEEGTRAYYGTRTRKREINVSPDSYSTLRVKKYRRGTKASNDKETIIVNKGQKAPSHPEEIKSEDERLQELKRKPRHLPLKPSVEAMIQSSKFWSVNPEQIQFTDKAFLKKPIFLLNSFISGEKKVNQAFSEFIREGVATPGFLPLPATLDIEKIASWTYSELRDNLTLQNNTSWGAFGTAMWLKDATVGSFVVMRHEYSKCKFCPKRLIVDGKYIGPVYVIGIITKKIVPCSEEERDIADNKMGEFCRNRWPIHNVCRVRWEKMGFKGSLTDATQNYINHACQPTVQRICKAPDKDFVRHDLWMNATIPIGHDEFPDKFDHREEW